MIRIDVTQSRELTAMFRALKFVEKEWLSVFSKEARAKVEPEWKQAIEASRPNRLQRAVLVRTSRVSVSRKSILLKSGGVGRLSSGASARSIARATEFGQDQTLRSKYLRKGHPVTRRTARPVGARNARGKVVWPALERFVPRAMAVSADLFYEVLRRVPGVK